MDEAEIRGVQGQAISAGIIVGTVEFIAENRVAERGHVNAQLVGAAGDGFQFDPGCIPDMIDAQSDKFGK